MAPAAGGAAAGDVARALAGVVKAYGRDRLELEFRLGHRGRGGAFVPGVPEAEWTRLKAALDASGDASSSKICPPTYAEARERIAGDSSGAKYVVPAASAAATPPAAPGGDAAAAQGYLMHKKRVRDVDVDVGTWCCRASMSLEVVEPGQSGGQSGGLGVGSAFKYERHKKRWSYRYKCWSIDLTAVASNLPHQLDNDGMSYEVEIELVDTSVLFTMPMPVLAEWGLQLARDMCSLM